LEAFAQFSSELDETTRKQLERGKRLTEILKQGQYVPMPVENQVAVLYAGTNGYFDDVPVEKMKETEDKFHNFLSAESSGVLKMILEKKELTTEVEENLKKAIEDFRVINSKS